MEDNYTKEYLMKQQLADLMSILSRLIDEITQANTLNINKINKFQTTNT